MNLIGSVRDTFHSIIYSILRPDQSMKRSAFSDLLCSALDNTPSWLWVLLLFNVLLFYSIPLLTEEARSAWVPIPGLLWLSLRLVRWPWAAFVDWLAVLALLVIVVAAVRRAASAPADSAETDPTPLARVNTA